MIFYVVGSGHIPTGGEPVGIFSDEESAKDFMRDVWNLYPDLWLYKATISELRAMSYVLDEESFDYF